MKLRTAILLSLILAAGLCLFLWRPPMPPSAPRPAAPAAVVRAEVDWGFSPPPGFHPQPVRVSLRSLQASGMTVRYTTDGTEPSNGSPRFADQVLVETSAVLRAAGFRGGERVTRVVSASYFIQPLPRLPVFSISMEPDDFRSVHLSNEARGREWERPAFLEVFDREGERVAATGFGLRLHGGAGRQGVLASKKAYRAYFRKSYGQEKLRIPLFPGSKVKEFDELVLRSGYNDRFRPDRGDYNVRAAYLRDEVIRSVHRDMGAPAARGSWCLLFVDMEPRGLYNVVERPGDRFLSAHLGGGEWDVIKNGDRIKSGSPEEWTSLLEAVRRSTPGEARSYDELRRRIDLENFTSYMILNLWAQNHDWPYNNWYAARRRAPGARWIFLAWDAEWGLGLRPAGWEADSLLHVLSQGNSIRDIFAALLGQEEYRGFFLRRLKEHLDGALRPEKVLAHIAREKEALAPFMEEELVRFSGGYSVEDWRENVAGAERFARERGAAFLRLMESRLAEPFQMPEAIQLQFDDQVLIPGGPVHTQAPWPPRVELRIQERR